MNTPSEMTIERALNSYSVDIEQWWDGAGDTDQTLGVREWLDARTTDMSDEQRSALAAADAKAAAKADGFPVAGSFDVVMLKQIADLARGSGARLKRVA